MLKLNVSDSRQNVHTYTVDWQPDQLTWSIDGNVLRTLKKSDTWNETSGAYHYPQTPSRIQLSLWPAGLSSNGEGTIEWAGGLVDWDSPYMQNGYYYAMVNDVTVECYDPPSGWNNDFGDNAYYYLSDVGTNNTVAIGNNDTVLASFLATGNNPDYNPNAKASGTASSSAASSTATSSVETVPGVSGGGNAASSGEAPVDTGSDDSSSSSSSSSDSSSSSGSSTFSQGSASDGTSEAAPRIVAGSVVALLGFFAVALML
jgi:beta-glucanase (GH16 family)